MIRPFSALNEDKPQCSSTSHGTPINEVSVSLYTVSPAHPITCPHHRVAHWHSI
jgi:hypothetical protein